MPYRVSLTNQARTDLNDIYASIEASTSVKAQLWFDRLESAIQSLTEMPNRTPVTREDFKLRHLLYGNKPHIYRILYHVDEVANLVTVVSVRHGARAPRKPNLPGNR